MELIVCEINLQYYVIRWNSYFAMFGNTHRKSFQILICVILMVVSISINILPTTQISLCEIQ